MTDDLADGLLLAAVVLALLYTVAPSYVAALHVINGDHPTVRCVTHGVTEQCVSAITETAR